MGLYVKFILNEQILIFQVIILVNVVSKFVLTLFQFSAQRQFWSLALLLPILQVCGFRRKICGDLVYHEVGIHLDPLRLIQMRVLRLVVDPFCSDFRLSFVLE